MSPTLSVDRVSWQVPTGAHVLDRVALSAGAGEFIALLGRNGAGKSTLLDLMAGLRRPTSGAVMLNGRPLSAWPARERARQIAHLPQLTRDALPFTVEQAVAMGRYPHVDRWFESAADHEAIDRAMTRAHCEQWRDRPMSQLSAGERQRALLAACLAQDASILLMDEPSTFMDVDQQLQCFALLAEETAAGRLCVAVTHDPNLALKFCTRLVVLSAASVVFDGSPARALADASWMAALSTRLHVVADRNDRPWITYQ